MQKRLYGFEAPLEDFEVEILLGGEVIVDGSLRYAHLLGYLFHGDLVVAFLGEKVGRGPQYLVAAPEFAGCLCVLRTSIGNAASLNHLPHPLTDSSVRLTSPQKIVKEKFRVVINRGVLNF